MGENLDKYIKDSKVVTPDSSEYRRLNRMLLKERMESPPARNKRHLVLVILVVVVFALLVSGRVAQQGRDGGDNGQPPGDVVDTATDGPLVKVVGVSYGGKTQWIKFTRKTVQGEDITTREPTASPPSEIPDNWDHFLAVHFSDLRAKAGAEPPHQKFRMTADGVLLEVAAWTFEFPAYGEVTRYEGFPVDK